MTKKHIGCLVQKFQELYRGVRTLQINSNLGSVYFCCFWTITVLRLQLPLCCYFFIHMSANENVFRKFTPIRLLWTLLWIGAFEAMDWIVAAGPHAFFGHSLDWFLGAIVQNTGHRVSVFVREEQFCNLERWGRNRTTNSEIIADDRFRVHWF